MVLALEKRSQKLHGTPQLLHQGRAFEGGFKHLAMILQNWSESGLFSSIMRSGRRSVKGLIMVDDNRQVFSCCRSLIETASAYAD